MIVDPYRFASAPPPAGTPHRYWRIYVTDSVSPAYGTVSIGEIEMASTVGGANLLSSSTPWTESYSYSPPTFNGAKTIDGDLTDAWVTYLAAPAYPQWLRFDFGSAVAVGEVRICPRQGFAPDEAPGAFTIESSDDDSTWTVEGTYTASPTTYTSLTFHSFPVP